MLLPNLIIGGVHKAGTTSVFTYLSEHPDVCASSVKEIGFFMPLLYNEPLPPIGKYAEYFSHCNSSKKILLEASPSYIYGKEVIAGRIRTELGSALKIIFILRNPADRLFSFYERKKTNSYLSDKISFREFVQKSVASGEAEIPSRSDDEEMLFIRGFREGCYIEYLPPWFDVFGENLEVLFFEDLKNDPAEFMKHLCNWLSIDFSFYQPNDFVIENQTVAFRNKWLHRSLLGVNKKFEGFWRKNVELKRTLRNLYKALNTSKSGREKMIDSDLNFLNELYAPYNQRLSIFLSKKGITRLPRWLKF